MIFDWFPPGLTDSLHRTAIRRQPLLAISRLRPYGDPLHSAARFCGDLRLSDLRRDDRRRRAPASHVFLPDLFARRPFYRRLRVYPVPFFLPPSPPPSFHPHSPPCP